MCENCDQAWEAYARATEPALKAYKEAIAPAWKAYEEACKKCKEWVVK